MKEKIKNILVVCFFCLSLCFLFITTTKQTKKENIVMDNNSMVTINVESKKYGLYKKLENDVKEDYSYRKIKTIINAVCDCKISEKEIKNINSDVIENITLDNSEDVIEEEKDVVIDEVIKEEITEEEIIDVIENNIKIEEMSKEIIIEENNEEIVKENLDEDIIEENKEIILNNYNESLVLENNNEIFEVKPIIKNGFYEENGCTYYYENDKKVTGLKVIDGVNHYFSSVGKYLGTKNIKVIDVSYYQGNINWDLFIESDCYGVILRIGYYDTLDKKFEEYINNVKRLNIPYGIYLFSYSTTITGSLKEAVFTNSVISKYNLEPSLGIYYDIESWSSSNGASSDNITMDMYDKIIFNYINTVSNYVDNKYKVKVYSGRWYALNRLSSYARSFVDWVAEYNSTCKYTEKYSMWQYTSKGSVPGISGNVDISYIIG